jgi:hypothetical protein
LLPSADPGRSSSELLSSAPWEQGT